VDELMPQARAAARQTGGRTPLGLALPGKQMVIFVGEIRDAWPNMMVQDAIKRALEERGVKTQIVTIWDAMGLSESEFRQVREALREYTISDGQRELDSFFTTTGQMVDFKKGRQWVKERDPGLFNATWPELVIPDPKLGAIAGDYINKSSAAVVAWLDKNPQIDWVMWRGANRPNTRKAMRHHGEKFLGNYTFLDLYDLMSQVPAFPADVWRMVESKTIEALAFVERAEVTDPEGTAFGYDLKENDNLRVGYIRLDEFSSHAAEQMKVAIEDLNNKKISGYVLDLRGNPGGLLFASVDIARMWLKKGEIVSTIDRRGGDRHFSANGTDITNLPLLILVDNGSASASEILTGALKENGRATIVGTTTYGKGTVQSVHALSDGSGLAVTIARYYTPSGTDINHKGINPDVYLDLSIDQQLQLRNDPSLVGSELDPQYLQAVSVLKKSSSHLTKPMIPAKPIGTRLPNADIK
jgi:hypothetical protein